MIDYIKNWYHRHFSDPQVAFLAVFFAAIFGLLYFFGDILLPVLIATILAYLLEAPVAWLERRRVPRFAGFLMIFILFLSAVVAILLAIVPLLIREFSELVTDIPRLVPAFQKDIMQFTERYPEFFSGDQVAKIFQSIQTELARAGQKILALSMASLRGAFNLLLYLIMIPLLIFFFLKDKIKIKSWFMQFMPQDSNLLSRVFKDVDKQLGKYIRGKFWEMVLVWIASTVVFYFIGLPYSVFNGFLVGISVLIPYVGALLAFFPIAIVGFMHFGPGTEFLLVLISYLVIQFIDGNLLAPLFLAEVVNLHPVAVLLSILFFGGLWGVWGVFFAIPLATLIHTVIVTQKELQGDLEQHSPATEKT